MSRQLLTLPFKLQSRYVEHCVAAAVPSANSMHEYVAFMSLWKWADGSEGVCTENK
jgi:hypothetical protein